MVKCTAQADPLAVLRSLEWSSTSYGPGSGPMGSGGGGNAYAACPTCRGLKSPNREFIADAVGHRSNCALAAALSATPAPSDQDASQAQGDMAAFGASEAACYFYPGEHQQAERTAFCEGAAHAVSAPGATAQDGDACTCQRFPTHQANDCPAHGLDEPTYTAGERVDAPTPTIPAGMVAEPDPFDDCLGIHVQANARRFAAAPKQAEQQGVESSRKVAFYHEPGHDIRPGETLPDRDRRIYQQGRHDALNDEPEAFQ